MVAHLQYMACARIGHCDDACLRRQCLQPVRQTVLRMLPVFRRGSQPLVHHAAVFFLRHQLAKRVLPLSSPTFAAGGGESVKGETVHAFFFQMQECAFHQRKVVGGDVVHRRIVFGDVIGAANADNGDIDIRQQALYFTVVVIGDHPVATL